VNAALSRGIDTTAPIVYDAAATRAFGLIVVYAGPLLLASGALCGKMTKALHAIFRPLEIRVSGKRA
jgi:hypothetical protein